MIITDDFNRADENPIAAPWVNVDGTQRVYQNGTYHGSTGTSGWAIAARAGLTGPALYAAALVKATNNESYRRLGTYIGDGAAGGYLYVGYQSGALYILKWSGGSTVTQLATIAGSVENGDVIEGRRLADGSHALLMNGSVALTAAADASPIACSAVGFLTELAFPTFESFEGGDLAAAVTLDLPSLAYAAALGGAGLGVAIEGAAVARTLGRSRMGIGFSIGL